MFINACRCILNWEECIVLINPILQEVITMLNDCIKGASSM